MSRERDLTYSTYSHYSLDSEGGALDFSQDWGQDSGSTSSESRYTRYMNNQATYEAKNYMLVSMSFNLLQLFQLNLKQAWLHQSQNP